MNSNALHVGLVSALAMTLAGAILVQQNSGTVAIDALAGRKLFTSKKCGDCHAQGAAKFTAIKANTDSAFIADHSTKLDLPVVLKEAKTDRQKKRVLGQEAAALAAYLNKRKEAEAAPANLVTAGYAMIREGCRNCHIIDGAGKETGPNMKGVGSRHDKKWIVDHFINPQAFVNDSVMPKFDALPKEELEAMADYLLTMK